MIWRSGFCAVVLHLPGSLGCSSSEGAATADPAPSGSEMENVPTSTATTTLEVTPPVPPNAPPTGVRSDHWMAPSSRCCAALRQNAVAAPGTMKHAYRTAVSICDKLRGMSLPDEEKLAQIRLPLVNAPLPSSCK